MTLEEEIKRFTDNAEYERTHGNLQGCLEFKQLADWMKELKQLMEQTRWIPVSERLPEEHLCNDGYIEPSDYVLVWGDHGNYGVSRYWGNRRSKLESPNTYKDWVDLDWVVQKPIAWIPLPEPYKAESENQ